MDIEIYLMEEGESLTKKEIERIFEQFESPSIYFTFDEQSNRIKLTPNDRKDE